MSKSEFRPRLDTVRSEFDPKLERIGTGVDVKLSDRLKWKVKHQNGAGLVSTDLVAKRWKVGYDCVKKTMYGQYEHKFEGFDVKVKQRVPDLNWSVIPSPELELETKLIKQPDMTDSLELKYDMSKRLAAFEEKLKFGKKHECTVSADSANGFEGASLQWKTKLGKPYAKTLSAKYSKKKGPMLAYSVDPSDQFEVKLETGLYPKVLKGEVTYKPEKAERAEVGINFQHPFNTAEKPRAEFFVKWKFD